MKRFAFLTAATALTLSLAAPALANDQLATSLGVDAASYSTAQLAELKTAMDEGNQTRINFILDSHNDANATTTSSKSYNAANANQLATSLGVSASDYTRAELVALKDATDHDEWSRIKAIKEHSAQNSANTVESREQLAQSLGVDANDYTRAELVNKHKS